MVTRAAWLRRFFDHMCDTARVRTAYRCRAYPDEVQQAVLSRTFGCVRVVWNRTLATRHSRWHLEGRGMSYAESDRALTAMKKDPDLAFLSEVSSVPLQQALRHQHRAFQAFFAKRARHLERKARSLARYQRRLARSQKGSANRAKAAAKVARAHRKVRNARRDFLHRASTSLVRKADLIVIEDLAVNNMIRNRHLARAISACGWGEFRRQLEYKCERYGRHLVVIDRWYPSSKTCSACGHLLADLSLSTRNWKCPSCGTRHDRDINAAKNILAAGLAVARGSPGNACGAEVRHSGPPECARLRNRNPGPREPESPSFRAESSQVSGSFHITTR
jgi:IS605 OrfB family transposase